MEIIMKVLGILLSIGFLLAAPVNADESDLSRITFSVQ